MEGSSFFCELLRPQSADSRLELFQVRSEAVLQQLVRKRMRKERRRRRKAAEEGKEEEKEEEKEVGVRPQATVHTRVLVSGLRV